MNLNLKGKNFLITGSSRGIGKAIAQIFLDEEANVGLVARSSNDLERTANSLKKSTGSKIFFWSSDLSVQSSVDRLLGQVLEKWSTIDGLILNVGDGKSFHDPITSTDQWNNVWSTNFNTALYTARAFLESLKTSSGCIVIISSICGLEALGAPTDYSVAKAALNAFSKNLAKKVGPNVRVNTVAPGNIYFEGGTWEKKTKENKPKVDAMLENEVPLKRFGTPGEVADAVTFLCSDRASFITGSTLVVDGGQTRSF
jgi:3-oxoacyl-[acyl-carrier protein] reductase